ncbi:MAG: hypothetical protein JRH20_19310 [Deltaproteobacteria bacterium]|nr:hypothetical protein [Deltaproteobacteria bacterium]
MWPLYNFISILAAPLLLPLFGLHPRLKGGLLQRLGFLPTMPRGAVWFHGASAGDVNALLPVAQEWAARGGESCASALTRSGVDFLERVAPEIARFFAPLDISIVSRRVLTRLAPRALILEHLELWPGLWRMAHRAGVPVALVNARLSAASMRRYRRFPSLFEAPLRALSMVAAASSDDAQRLTELGVRPDRIWVSAQSTKHARPHTSLLLSSRPPCIVLGSLHPGEEELLLPYLPLLVGAGAHVIVAPRYPHRAKSLLAQVARLGLRAALASQRHEDEVPPPVEVLDGMGQLPAAYEQATVAFIGGSLERRGGHNVLEAARAGCAVVTGPYVENCAGEMRALEQVGAGMSVAEPARIVSQLCAWSAHDGPRSAACQQAAAVVAGEARLAVKRIVGWLESS